MIKELKEKALALAARHKGALVKTSLAAGAAGFAGLFLLFGPPKMIELTESPEFCALCHASQDQDWAHSAHRTARCIDCHLPNDNVVNHYFWKGVDGNKDVFLHFSGLGDGNDTELTRHGRKVLQANCIRCHTGMVAHINNKRSCTDCHRTFSHRRTAQTLIREEMKK